MGNLFFRRNERCFLNFWTNQSDGPGKKKMPSNTDPLYLEYDEKK